MLRAPLNTLWIACLTSAASGAGILEALLAAAVFGVGVGSNGIGVSLTRGDACLAQPNETTHAAAMNSRQADSDILLICSSSIGITVRSAKLGNTGIAEPCGVLIQSQSNTARVKQ